MAPQSNPWTFKFAVHLSGIIFIVIRAVLANQPNHDCPQYVEEGSTLDCNCYSPNGVIATQLTWVDVIGTRLVVNDVTRQMNGTSFTCRMTVSGVVTTKVYTLQVAYGPEDVTITGAKPFPTDGSKTLTLTCAAKANPLPSYLWSGVTCNASNHESACSFAPTLQEDGKRIACVATGGFVGNSGVKMISAMFTVELLYPPAAEPTITTLGPGEFLKAGDVINCTVTGGQPVVTSVDFACSTPDLPDQSDVTVVDPVTNVTSLVSYVTMTSSAMDQKETFCQCSATWGPDPALYLKRKVEFLPKEYKASVTNFTLNGMMTSLVMQEADDVTSTNDVDLTCTADGRPSPRMTLSKNGVLGKEGILSQQNGVTTAKYTIQHAKCENSGMYVCTVTNTPSLPSQSVVHLSVHCGPRGDNSGWESDNLQFPPLLTSGGLEIVATANPVPTSFDYSSVEVLPHDNGSTTYIKTPVQDLFTTSCSADNEAEFKVTCRVSGVKVTQDDLGFYSVTIGNGLGTIEYYFRVESQILTTPSAAGSVNDIDDISTASTAAIAGGVSGGLLVIIVIVVIACLVRRDRANPTPDDNLRRRRQKKLEDDDDFVEHINETYVSADTIDVVFENNHHQNQVPILKKTTYSTSTTTPIEDGAPTLSRTTTSTNTYEEVNEQGRNSMQRQISADSLDHYASIAETGVSPPSDTEGISLRLSKKRGSRVSFKLDRSEMDNGGDEEDGEEGKGGLKSPRRKARDGDGEEKEGAGKSQRKSQLNTNTAENQQHRILNVSPRLSSTSPAYASIDDLPPPPPDPPLSPDGICMDANVGSDGYASVNGYATAGMATGYASIGSGNASGSGYATVGSGYASPATGDANPGRMNSLTSDYAEVHSVVDNRKDLMPPRGLQESSQHSAKSPRNEITHTNPNPARINSESTHVNSDSPVSDGSPNDAATHSAGVRSGSVKGPLGDIYTQVVKTPAAAPVKSPRPPKPPRPATKPSIKLNKNAADNSDVGNAGSDVTATAEKRHSVEVVRIPKKVNSPGGVEDISTKGDESVQTEGVKGSNSAKDNIIGKGGNTVGTVGADVYEDASSVVSPARKNPVKSTEL